MTSKKDQSGDNSVEIDPTFALNLGIQSKQKVSRSSLVLKPIVAVKSLGLVETVLLGEPKSLAPRSLHQFFLPYWNPQLA